MAEELFQSLLQRSRYCVFLHCLKQWQLNDRDREGLSEYRAPPAMKNIAHKDPKEDVSRLFIGMTSRKRFTAAGHKRINMFS